ncbi:prolyl 4-hydroxylase subunit alpha-2-like [Drosophila tropicalis]|uniref:prolyl 4-hydroxylase subunit alpha-2-like n=1 Tax=Drosophila tropicalis TaxID=46794 RepID=UPI0035AB8617
MQSDWLYWQLYMENATSFQLSYMEEVKSFLPQSNDFIDAAEGLRRLQKVYQMSSVDMANGLLDGVQYNSTFTPLDCFALAKYNSNHSYWQAAEQWLSATISRFGQPNHRPELHKLHGLRLDAVYDELARVLLNQNKYAEALQAQRKALDLAPRDANLLHKFHSLQMHILTFPFISNTSFETENHAAVIDALPFCCSGKCEATWLGKNSDNVTRRMSLWIEDVSNLDSNIGDLYQVMNYGVGGLFEAHSDTMRKNEVG